MSYRRFAAMVATSTMAIIGLMYTTVVSVDHVWWSQTKFWMALYMGGAMAVIMLSMYTDRRKNLAIFLGSAVVIAGAFGLVRSQTTVDDVAYMKAMIPHHSIAILTSERAYISDPPGARARRRDHRGTAARDRRDGGPDRRPRERARICGTPIQLLT